MIDLDEMEERWIADTRLLTFYEFVEAEEQAERDRVALARHQAEIETWQAAQSKLLAAAQRQGPRWGGNQIYFTPNCQTLTVQMSVPCQNVNGLLANPNRQEM